MKAWLPIVAAALAGCTASLGTVGVITPDAERAGLKLLRPGVTGRSCRASLVGFPLDAGEPDVRQALAQILALDTEGDVVVNAELQWEHLVTGIYNRRCIEVRGDLARSVSTVLLPMPSGHHHEHPR